MLLPCPAPDAAAQLVELGETEAFGALDDDQRRIGDVDPDLDHRRRDQHARSPRANDAMTSSLSGPFIRPWTSPTLSAPKRIAEHRRTLLGRGGVDSFRFPRPAGHTQ